MRWVIAVLGVVQCFAGPVEYFQARGIYDDALRRHYEEADRNAFIEALEILFGMDSSTYMKQYIGRHEHLLEGIEGVIDHVGIELYGPLQNSIASLKDLAQAKGLHYAGEIVFPSTQVIEVVQRSDPSAVGVTIGKVYFTDSSGNRRCIELFQTAPKDESSPQVIEATIKRKNYLETPIDHISIELSSVEALFQMHKRIHKSASPLIQPSQNHICYNPNDGSLQTKVLLKEREDTPFSKIIEFAYYDNGI